MTELQKLRELCEAQARVIDNYEHLLNEMKELLILVHPKNQFVHEEYTMYAHIEPKNKFNKKGLK